VHQWVLPGGVYVHRCVLPGTMVGERYARYVHPGMPTRVPTRAIHHPPGYTPHIHQSRVVTASSQCRPGCGGERALGSNLGFPLGGEPLRVLRSSFL